jgi:pyruvate formate lyase activating enzyme
LLVPHYIDLEEIEKIVKFIADLDKTIPYSLLAFYPHYMFMDMGFTSRKFAEECYSVAKKAGLVNVKIGNVHLLK